MNDNLDSNSKNDDKEHDYIRLIALSNPSFYKKLRISAYQKHALSLLKENKLSYLDMAKFLEITPNNAFALTNTLYNKGYLEREMREEKNKRKSKNYYWLRPIFNDFV